MTSYHCANYREPSKVFHKKTFSASCHECTENASEEIKDVFLTISAKQDVSSKIRMKIILSRNQCREFNLKKMKRDLNILWNFEILAHNINQIITKKNS